MNLFEQPTLELYKRAVPYEMLAFLDRGFVRHADWEVDAHTHIDFDRPL